MVSVKHSAKPFRKNKVSFTHLFLIAFSLSLIFATLRACRFGIISSIFSISSRLLCRSFLSTRPSSTSLSRRFSRLFFTFPILLLVVFLLRAFLRCALICSFGCFRLRFRATSSRSTRLGPRFSVPFFPFILRFFA
uniref:Candidate secreted effector n=1 Tax=Meloidogyne incognita TaxID=6306 RepID=A0A914MJ45_MELIC